MLVEAGDEFALINGVPVLVGIVELERVGKPVDDDDDKDKFSMIGVELSVMESRNTKRYFVVSHDERDDEHDVECDRSLSDKSELALFSLMFNVRN